MDDGLPETADPLLLAEGVVRLQTILVTFGPPSAAYTETVLNYMGESQARC